jgi:hypothetical protein
MDLIKKKENFSKIFKYNKDYQNLYLKILNANSEIELNDVIIEYITDIIPQLIGFDEKKDILLKYIINKNSCSSQNIRVINCTTDSELSEITAQNYLWWRHLKK